MLKLPFPPVAEPPPRARPGTGWTGFLVCLVCRAVRPSSEVLASAAGARAGGAALPLRLVRGTDEKKKVLDRSFLFWYILLGGFSLERMVRHDNTCKVVSARSE